MVAPSGGFQVYLMTNNVQLSFWYEADAQALWLIVKGPQDAAWTGMVQFTVGTAMLNLKGGPVSYAIEAVKLMNTRIRQRWPELFGTAPPTALPSELVAQGPDTVEFAQKLAGMRLEGNQFVL